jgi:hypothetical protein
VYPLNYSEIFAFFCSSAVEDFSAAGSLHSFAESVGFSAFSFAWLVSAFHKEPDE